MIIAPWSPFPIYRRKRVGAKERVKRPFKRKRKRDFDFERERERENERKNIIHSSCVF